MKSANLTHHELLGRKRKAEEYLKRGMPRATWQHMLGCCSEVKCSAGSNIKTEEGQEDNISFQTEPLQ
jgi:hypothetical protein